MTPEDVRTLFDYNYWARDRLLRVVLPMSEPEYARSNGFNYASIRAVLTHCLDAEYSWRCRFEGGRDLLITEDQVPTPLLLASRWRDEEARMRAYLGTLTEARLAADLVYQRPDGSERRLPGLWLALMHLLNHSTQHRSEAAEALTMVGRSPGDLDLGLFASQLR